MVFLVFSIFLGYRANRETGSPSFLDDAPLQSAHGGAPRSGGDDGF